MKQLNRKNVAYYSALPDEEPEGFVDHLISVYDTVDKGGDVAHAGMFDTEALLSALVVDNHRRASGLDVIGVPVKAWEVGREGLPEDVLERHPKASGGMMIRTKYLLDTPEGSGIYKRIKVGALRGHSYAYYINKSEPGDLEGKRVKHLYDVEVVEYGPVLFPMHDGAVTVDVKTEEEFSKVVDETENYVHIRIRNSSEFEKDSLRTIWISKDKGIKAITGRLEGKTSTTIQSYLFEKSKWTVAEAKKWVSEHEKSMNLTSLLGAVTSAWYATGQELLRYVYDDAVVVEGAGGKLFRVPFEQGDEGYAFADREGWEEGTMEFVPSPSAPMEDEKSGLLIEAELALLEMDLAEIGGE